jgi:hypothetical protein
MLYLSAMSVSSLTRVMRSRDVYPSRLSARTISQLGSSSSTFVTIWAQMPSLWLRVIGIFSFVMYLGFDRSVVLLRDFENRCDC